MIIIFPLLDNDSSMISRLGATFVNSLTNSSVLSAKSFESVTKKHYALGSCSACANMSVAKNSGFALSSANINTSDGPAGNSIST